MVICKINARRERIPAKDETMDLENGDMLIYSGEGDSGTFERYFGARSPKAIRSKLSRERCGGDRWASAWIELDDVQDKGWREAGIEHKVYGKLGRGLDEITDQRAVACADVRENPAAALAARRRGKSPASAENGKKGGRPRKVAE